MLNWSLRDWICVSIGWAAAIIAFLLSPHGYLGALICFTTGFTATSLALWISKI